MGRSKIDPCPCAAMQRPPRDDLRATLRDPSHLTRRLFWSNGKLISNGGTLRLRQSATQERALV